MSNSTIDVEGNIQQAWEEHCTECRLTGRIDPSSVYNSDECFEEFKQEWLENCEHDNTKVIDWTESNSGYIELHCLDCGIELDYDPTPYCHACNGDHKTCTCKFD